MTPALPAGSTVAVIGAERSGKTQLANALAARLREHAVTVADGSPLCGAVLREWLADDRSLLAEAGQAQRRYARTLLMGLDLPSPAGLAADALQRRERIDALLRRALVDAGLPFAVIHGQGPERLANALRALGFAAAESPRRIAARDCDKCSDPACEHRLFTDLLGQRLKARSAS